MVAPYHKVYWMGGSAAGRLGPEQPLRTDDNDPAGGKLRAERGALALGRNDKSAADRQPGERRGRNEGKRPLHGEAREERALGEQRRVVRQPGEVVEDVGGRTVPPCRLSLGERRPHRRDRCEPRRPVGADELPRRGGEGLRVADLQELVDQARRSERRRDGGEEVQLARVEDRPVALATAFQHGYRLAQ